ncbi:MAG: hypothetical protein FH761_08455 [Firmicutes bacterium]|nr:hypothetical protein [Bacillota bacterium]
MKWLLNKFISNGRDFVGIKGASEAGMLMDLTNTIALLALIVGFFFIMGGNKKIGTKITSFTFIGYLLIKVAGAYV